MTKVFLGLVVVGDYVCLSPSELGRRPQISQELGSRIYDVSRGLHEVDSPSKLNRLKLKTPSLFSYG